MKTNPTVLKRIRKLLRLAASGGHEGARAAERAQALMDRHGLNEVSFDDQVRVEIRGVDGVLWREQLLFAVASASGVALLQGVKDGKKKAALQGERVDVDNAIIAYRRTSLEITRKCQAIRHEQFPDMPEGHFAELLWNRIFHIGATTSLGDTVAEQIARARRESSNRQPLGTQPAPADDTAYTEVKPEKNEGETQDERMKREKAQSDRDLAELINIIGEQAAYRVQETAFRKGVETGKTLVLHERRALPERRTLREAHTSEALLLT